jgi:NifU-like protein involved in Fe-S cluster formation
LAGTRAPKLYSPAVLALATRLADFPLDPSLAHRAEVRSRTCGSVVALGLDLGGEGAIARVGMQVSACAIGQASAAVLADAVCGRTPADIAATLAGIEAWLADEAPLPDWPELALLSPARDHPARHAALLLPWKAASKALSTGETAG